MDDNDICHTHEMVGLTTFVLLGCCFSYSQNSHNFYQGREHRWVVRALAESLIIMRGERLEEQVDLLVFSTPALVSSLIELQVVAVDC